MTQPRVFPVRAVGGDRVANSTSNEIRWYYGRNLRFLGVAEFILVSCSFLSAMIEFESGAFSMGNLFLLWAGCWVGVFLLAAIVVWLASPKAVGVGNGRIMIRLRSRVEEIELTRVSEVRRSGGLFGALLRFTDPASPGSPSGFRVTPEQADAVADVVGASKDAA